MEKLTLNQAAAYCEGEFFGKADLPLTGVQIDSRQVEQGDLFAALKGDKTDGHLFVGKALERGAAALVEKSWAKANAGALASGRGLIAVASPKQGLQLLAKHYRERFGVEVVGITGSTGKTTTKDMTAAVLGQWIKVHKTEGNFNNELGLPLTLLGLNSSHRAAVVEMGMRGTGEISFLASLAQPTVGVITNIGTTHMELLGSQENIARAKGELLAALPPAGTAVLNADDEWCRRLGKDLSCRVVYFGLDEAQADLRAKEITVWQDQGTRFTATFENQAAEVFLPLPGRHNVSNALAALAVGLSLGLDLNQAAKGLQNLKLTGMRLEICQGFRRSTIINDTYNANPASMKASLQVLAERGADAAKVAVLGSMFELGPEEEKGHKEVGAAAAGVNNLAFLLTVGRQGRLIAQGAQEAGLAGSKTFSVETTAEAVDFLTQRLPEGAWVLVKGSRGMKMEQVVAGLVTN